MGSEARVSHTKLGQGYALFHPLNVIKHLAALQEQRGGVRRRGLTVRRRRLPVKLSGCPPHPHSQTSP